MLRETLVNTHATVINSCNNQCAATASLQVYAFANASLAQHMWLCQQSALGLTSGVLVACYHLLARHRSLKRRCALQTHGQDLLSYPEGIRARTIHSHMAA